MMQCRAKGTKIPYEILFTKIFYYYRIFVVAKDGFPFGSEITITNIRRMKIKLEPSGPTATFQQH